MDRGRIKRAWRVPKTIPLWSASPDFSCSLGSCWNLGNMSLRVGAGALRLRPSPGLLLLGVLLLSAGLAFAGADPEGDDEPRDLQCLCVATTSQVHPKKVNNLEVIKAGPHCPKVQMIATLKNGRKICLDPQAPMYKRVIKKLLES
ncbi:platelet factor 4-like [Choloepus didactylus]|uniref:platelet factor 4-like n=1 Tax=Choloepus didactylus TaxID=27675 RepID=UPI00189F5803|nr:platelet factor 4-like [Choloepus didactylus]